ncbi:MAG: hypothetical protein WC517_00330 [Patescibacteria group bacterium]
MFQKKQVAVQTKMVSSTKLVSVTALLVGVVLGGFVLNMAGAATVCRENSCTIVNKINVASRSIQDYINSRANESDWNLVYSPDSKDMAKLIKGVDSGLETKVVVTQQINNSMGQKLSYTCNSITTSQAPNNNVVTCDTGTFLNTKASSDGVSAYSVSSYQFATNHNGLLNMITYDKLGKVVDIINMGMGPKEAGQVYFIRWYQKK